MRRRSNRTLRRTVSNGSKKEQQFVQMAAMCVAASMLFLICTAPSIVILIGKPYWNQPPGSNAAYEIAKAVSNLTFYVTFSANFFLYCVTGDRFRSTLRSTLRRWCRLPDDDTGSSLRIHGSYSRTSTSVFRKTTLMHQNSRSSDVQLQLQKQQQRQTSTSTTTTLTQSAAGGSIRQPTATDRQDDVLELRDFDGGGGNFSDGRLAAEESRRTTMSSPLIEQEHRSVKLSISWGIEETAGGVDGGGGDGSKKLRGFVENGTAETSNVLGNCGGVDVEPEVEQRRNDAFLAANGFVVSDCRQRDDVEARTSERTVSVPNDPFALTSAAAAASPLQRDSPASGTAIGTSVPEKPTPPPGNRAPFYGDCPPQALVGSTSSSSNSNNCHHCVLRPMVRSTSQQHVAPTVLDLNSSNGCCRSHPTPRGCSVGGGPGCVGNSRVRYKRLRSVQMDSDGFSTV